MANHRGEEPGDRLLAEAGSGAASGHAASRRGTRIDAAGRAQLGRVDGPPLVKGGASNLSHPALRTRDVESGDHITHRVLRKPGEKLHSVRSKVTQKSVWDKGGVAMSEYRRPCPRPDLLMAFD